MEVRGLPEHYPDVPPARHLKRGRQTADSVDNKGQRSSNPVGHRPTISPTYRRKRAVALSISVLVVVAVPALILALVLLG